MRNISENSIDTPILVSIQNGLVDNTQFEHILNGQRLIILSIFEGFRLEGNQLTMTPTNIGWKVENSKEGKEISTLLLESEILCKTEQNLDIYRAEKFIVNCSLNGLSAIYRQNFKELYENHEKEINSIFNECYSILSNDYTLESHDIVKTRMKSTWSDMEHYSSTYQDVIFGRETEIDFLNGYIVNLGKKFKIDTSANQNVVDRIKT